jgi:hypothetical protein
MTDAYELKLDGLRDLAPDVIGLDGRPAVMPGSFYADASPDERAWLGLRHALYLLPTTELVDWLREHIGTRSAIEIGSGNGAMAEALDIAATDNLMQSWPEMAAYYAALGQPAITYGPNVIALEASAAVRLLRPEVVIGAWVTHRYNKRQHGLGGNQHGPRLDWIRERIDEYVFIGNTATHANHPLLRQIDEERVIYPDWLFSRGRGGRDFIAWFPTHREEGNG